MVRKSLEYQGIARRVCGSPEYETDIDVLSDNPEDTSNKPRKSVTYFGTPYTRESLFWNMWPKNKK